MGFVFGTARNFGCRLVLLKLPTGIASPVDLGRTALPAPLGTVEEVMARISAAEPGVEWVGPEWGWVWSSMWTIEVQFADADPAGVTDAVLLDLRGRGDDAVEFAFQLAEALGCIVFDHGGLRVLASAGDVGAWRAYQHLCEHETPDDVFDADGQPLGDAYGVQRRS